MIRAYRLCKTRHMAAAFTGEGARLNGGRWNSPGKAVVYTSSSLSLATLEVLVHLEDPDAFKRLFSWVPVEIPEDAVEQLRHLHAALAPGGVYLCITPSRLTGPHDISYLFDRFVKLMEAK